MPHALPNHQTADYDFAGYRRPACFVMALVAIKTAGPRDAALRFRVDNVLVANWLSTRLRNQNFAATVHHDAHSASVLVQAH